ncbi:6757_t:CDS:2 [Cetraspora pellucida]|uniref:6757_t:CDS:1 n=1 Tax=Cetraspora pellucida TaxID=1433469 RepID=A0ACA9N346_9GLOM|nr:6757_t:CDS:2 [Cetraspora pellucida]
MSDDTKMPLLCNDTKPDVSKKYNLWIQGLIKWCIVYKKKLANLKNPKCCATHILAAQPDFALQQSHIQEVIEAAGYICIFYSKFHCELNYIESFWAEAKCIARLNYDYTFKGLKRAVSRALNSVNIIKICHFARHSEHFMSTYKLELFKKAAVFAVKKYYSHHQILEKVLKKFAYN